MIAEVQASTAYDATTMAEGKCTTAACLEKATDDAGEFLDVCQPSPEETLQGSCTDRTMYGTTSVVFFTGLVKNVPVDTVVKVLCKVRKCGHIVVLGPNGFHLCSCLKLLQYGMPCRHFFAATVTHLERQHPLNGLCIHPRWRTSSEPWSVYGVLGNFDGHELSGCLGGLTDNEKGVCSEGSESDQNSRFKTAIRMKFIVDMTEVVNSSIAKAAANLSDGNIEAFTAIFSQLDGSISNIVKDETTGGGGAPSLHEQGQGNSEGEGRGVAVFDPNIPIIDAFRSTICLPDNGASAKRHNGCA